jgi:glycosyltransferase involved in cell wall biosynthesis
MKIGLLHFRVGETDGVSLEMEKWKTVLQSMGHEVHYIAGTLGKEKGYKVPLLSYEEERNLKIKELAFKSLLPYNEEDLRNMILKLKSDIRSQLDLLPKFDLIVVNNIWSLPHNLSAALAVYEYAKANKIKLVGHHHDFYFERDYYKNPTSEFVTDLLNSYFPPRDMVHVTINSIAQKALKTIKHLESYVVPNVFDFERKLWEKDTYNSKIPTLLSIKENDIVFLQATRVVRRKAIEMAIDVLKELNRIKSCYYGIKSATGKLIDENSRFIILLPGLQEETAYTDLIVKHAKLNSVELIFASELCTTDRSESDGTFSLWDFYAISDFVTYPSVKEGFGNQFLEAIFAKKPILIFEYPVYLNDIKKAGFEVVSLGSRATFSNGLFGVNEEITKSCAKEIMSILTNKEKYFSIVENNFEVGKTNFSYKVLSNILKTVIENIK